MSGYFRTSQINAAACSLGLLRPCSHRSRVRGFTLRTEGVAARTLFVQAPMEHLPVPDRAFDLVVAHGIWNLARSGPQFRLAVAEAARAARPGAGLFVFTFSRNALPAGVRRAT